VELLRPTAPDLPGIRVYDSKLEAEALKYRGIGRVHAGIAGIQSGLIEIERIGVLHDELTGAHDTESGPDFIAKLGLYLVEIDRQLLVAAQFPARNIGDDLLVGGAEAVIAAVSITHT